MAKIPSADMARCPGCGVEIPAEDLPAQRLHMIVAHLDVIYPRLVDQVFYARFEEKYGLR